jgi:hypothetical protein
MQSNRKQRAGHLAVLLITTAACQPASPDTAQGAQPLMADRARIIDRVAPRSTTEGRFDEQTRVYGYIVEARRGARLTVRLQASAGPGAELADGQPLDTVLSLSGPTDPAGPGPILASSDDGPGDSAAPALELAVERDGQYLVAFTSWQSPGRGRYRLDIDCAGTDFQCQRPAWRTPCQPGSLYVQGNLIDRDTTWDRCEIILLESLTVASGATLTIRPGVTVRANYLGTGTWGEVALNVSGTLQASGTASDPVRFTPIDGAHGWRGIRLSGPSHSLGHAVIEHAYTAVYLARGASATIRDTYIEGRSTSESTGVQVERDAQLVLERSLARKHHTGLQLAGAASATLRDTILRDNQRGIAINGEQAITSCNTTAEVSRWQDPVIEDSDIIHNGTGIHIAGSDVFLQVQRTNLVANQSHALVLHGGSIHRDSFVRASNIHGNNAGAAQIHSLHRSGTLDLTGNYWVHISDPQLSASWQRACGGAVTFRGFSPTPLTAGPRADQLIPMMRDQTLAASPL